MEVIILGQEKITSFVEKNGEYIVISQLPVVKLFWLININVISILREWYILCLIRYKVVSKDQSLDHYIACTYSGSGTWSDLATCAKGATGHLVSTRDASKGIFNTDPQTPCIRLERAV